MTFPSRMSRPCVSTPRDAAKTRSRWRDSRKDVGHLLPINHGASVATANQWLTLFRTLALIHAATIYL
jgi:hypothetical protein